jgi:hypothetical protein
MLAVTNLADRPCVLDLSQQIGDSPHDPLEVFGDGDYGDLGVDVSKLELRGYGYRWIRLHQAVG